MQIDIFSLGILLREMVTGEITQPYQMREHMGSLVAGHNCSPDVIALIGECCASDPRQRPSAEHVHDRLTARRASRSEHETPSTSTELQSERVRRCCAGRMGAVRRCSSLGITQHAARMACAQRLT